jgi:[ribosomal protein S5]-alanine N-acetyltransferase
LRFVEIGKNGQPTTFVGQLSDTANEVCEQTAKLYQTAGSFRPWVGYLVVQSDVVVGTCAFRSPPRNGEVEMAYFTFPGFEGRGLATEMARHLIEVARRQEPDIRIFAFTLPEKNASTRILQKLGFQFARETQDEDEREVWRWGLPGTGK